MPSNTTDRNQNARQSTQDEAEAIRGLTKHNQDYRRLPKALQAIVDAYRALDDADDYMDDAYSIVGTPSGLGPSDAPGDAMLCELSYLVEHTAAELRRHGVIEGALAWLASHPEGWDDEPDPDEPCPNCEGSGQMVWRPAEQAGGVAEETECDHCGGTGRRYATMP